MTDSEYEGDETPVTSSTKVCEPAHGEMSNNLHSGRSVGHTVEVSIQTEGVLWAAKQTGILS